ncbi:MAG: hypothetical protein ACUVX8_02280 [Candidatus Zipacnadales bacterium]
MIVGRPTWVHTKFREQKGLWDGKRDELVTCYKRDIIALTGAPGLGIITVGQNPLVGSHPQSLEKVNHETYRSERHLYRLDSSYSLAVGCKLENLIRIKECRIKYGGYPISITE